MGMLGVVTSIEVQACVADDPNVITWFELHTSVARPPRLQEIGAIRVAFDHARK